MRTTIDIPDPLFRAAKRRAAADGETLRAVVLRALRAHLGRAEARRYRFRWRSEEGTQLVPDAVLRSRAALYDFLGGRE